MENKLFEIRDRMTFVPMLAVRISGHDGYLARRAGYRGEYTVILINLNDSRAQNDPYEWNDRTYYTAHKYISENWGELDSDAVIDVEFILGETNEKKISERTYPL